MLLAVAGLKDDEIKQRTKKLAAGEWGEFAPVERQAYAFVAKLSSNPEKVSNADIKELATTFGNERAIDIIWYSSWVNFMTRVADAFQFNLERDNVFATPPKSEQPKPTDPKSPH